MLQSSVSQLCGDCRAGVSCAWLYSCVVQRLWLPVQGGGPSTRLSYLSVQGGAAVAQSRSAGVDGGSHQVLASCRGVLQGPCLCVPATYRAAFQARRCCLKGPPFSLFVVVGATLWLCMLGAALSRPPCILYMYMLACASLAALFLKGVSGQQSSACNRPGAYRGAALLASLGLSLCQVGAVRTCRGCVASGCGRCGRS